MEFLDTVADGIDNAVGAVLAPVADTAGAAAGALRRELTRTWHGVFGSPTPPWGTDWNAYSHQELYAMVCSDADPGQVGEQSSVLDGLGRGAYDCADELSSRRQRVADVCAEPGVAVCGVLADRTRCRFRRGVVLVEAESHRAHPRLGLGVRRAIVVGGGRERAQLVAVVECLVAHLIDTIGGR